MLPKEKRSEILQSICDKIIPTYVDFEVPLGSEDVRKDGKQAYAYQILSLGLFYLEYHDAIKLRKVMQLVSSVAGVTYYRCLRYLAEPTTTMKLSQCSYHYRYILTSRQAHQLLWSRFVNTRGMRDHNVSSDMHIWNTSTDCAKKPSTVLEPTKPQRLSHELVIESIGKLPSVLDNYNADNKIEPDSGSHSPASCAKDRDLMVTELMKLRVFVNSPGRHHTSFPEIKSSVLTKTNYSELSAWIETHIPCPYFRL